GHVFTAPTDGLAGETFADMSVRELPSTKGGRGSRGESGTQGFARHHCRRSGDMQLFSSSLSIDQGRVSFSSFANHLFEQLFQFRIFPVISQSFSQGR